jgi:hypothetical protein
MGVSTGSERSHRIGTFAMRIRRARRRALRAEICSSLIESLLPRCIASRIE